jgi:hypothetical protein
VSIIDFAYYSGTFNGQLSQESFDALLPVAEDIINLSVTKTIGTSPDDNVKKAVCYQVDYLDERGDVEGLTKSESMGTYSTNKTFGLQTSAGLPISKMALAFLTKSGNISRWA